MSDDDASSPAKLTPPAEEPSQIFPTRGRGGGGGSTSSGRGSGTPPPSPSQPQVAPPPLVEQGIYTFGPGAGSRPQAAQPQAEAAQPVTAQPPQPPKNDPSIYRFGPPSAQVAAHSQVADAGAQQQSQPQAPESVVQPQPTPVPQRTYANATRGDKPVELVKLEPGQAHAAGFKHTQFPLMDGSFKDHPEFAAAVYQLDASYNTQWAVEENGLPSEIKVAGLFAKEIIAVVAPGENTLLFFKGVALEPSQKIAQITFRQLADTFDFGGAAEPVVFIGTPAEAKEHLDHIKEVSPIGWMKDTKYSQFRGYARPAAAQTVAVGGGGATAVSTSPVMMTLSNLTSGGGTANWASIRMKPGSGVGDRVAFMRHTTRQFLPPGTQAFMRGTTIRIRTPEPLTADHKAGLQKVPGIHSVFLDVLPRRAPGAPGAPVADRTGPSKTELARQELADGIHEEYKECAALMGRHRDSNPTHDIRVITSTAHTLPHMKPVAEKLGHVVKEYTKLNAVVVIITNAEFLANPVSRRDSVSLSGVFMLRRQVIDPTLRA